MTRGRFAGSALAVFGLAGLFGIGMRVLSVISPAAFKGFGGKPDVSRISPKLARDLGRDAKDVSKY